MSVLIDLTAANAVIADPYELLNDDAPIATAFGKAVIVSLLRWQAEQQQLVSAATQVGVALPNTMEMGSVEPSLFERPLLSLSFPVFSDGRAFSQARILRDKYRYDGLLRANGTLLPDQSEALLRVGFHQLSATVEFVGFAAATVRGNSALRYQPDLQSPSDLRAVRRFSG